MNQPLIVVAVFLSGAFALFGVLLLVSTQVQRRTILRRLQETRTAAGVTDGAVAAVPDAAYLSNLSPFGTPSVDRILRSWGLMDRIALGLVQAHLRLRLAEYLLIRVVFGVFLAVAGLLLSRGFAPSPLFQLPTTPELVLMSILLILGYVLTRFYVQRRASKRREQFINLLPEALSLMSNSLRSGSGLLQVLQDMGQEMPPPLNEEFRIVAYEMSLGEDLEPALTHLQTRIRSYDLDLVVTAMLIQRRVGGNLAEVMESIAHTIRERVRILGEVKALTAEVRLSGMILAALPFVTGLALSIMSPGYLLPLFTDPTGRLIGLAGLGFLVIGIYLLRRLSIIEV